MARRTDERPGPAVRNLTFGTAATDYERYRLEYPDEVVDVILAYAERPVRSALEVGAGTGKATRRFAARGIPVTALEPDARMAALLSTTTEGLPVEPVLSTFENFQTPRRFDLLYAAASWHWTEPAHRWSHAAELLVPGGVLALFGMPADIGDPELFAAVDAVEKDVLPAEEQSVLHPWTVEEPASTGGFVEVAQRSLPSVLTTTVDEYVGRLTTVSAYLMLDPDARAEALRRVRAVLPDRFEVDAAVQLVMARRA